ncbi:MAG: selenocysteine-specific translation elongation factor [Chloroflexi bacterium]|nr:selenocysteine-specific translation elongation factor [Chloroflexota bacterium]
MFVLGTAGHIDHGKSTLVRALTGIDPDRLREEKERGMTIDLGFAWFKLPSGREVGIVDVPGHERFVKNMLAGVGGIDLALLIVAANEGVMPQTREHLAIIDLLKVKRGIVAITKKDLVDEEFLNLVRLEVEELIEPTVLAGAPLVAVSAVSGDGIPALITEIDNLLQATEPRPDLGRPRLPVDRVFTIAGAGTVVTGTLIDGSLAAGQEVEILPSRVKSRIRGLQTHRMKETRAEPGSRVAANLVGVNVADIRRGDVVTKPGWLEPAKMLTVKLQLLPYLPRPLRHNASVAFYTGSAEVMVKVRLLEAEELKPGGTAWAQATLAEPVAVINGDRFIIRSTMETLGGGEIVDVRASRLRRFRPEVIQALADRVTGGVEQPVLALLEARQPLELAALLSQTNLPADGAGRLVQSLIEQGKIITLPAGEHRLLFTGAGWRELARRAVSVLEEYHRRSPARTGMPKSELGSRLKQGSYAPAVIDRLAGEGVLVSEGIVVRLPAHSVRLSPAQKAKIDDFLKRLAESPYAPPTDQMLEPDLLNLLAEQGKIVRVSDSVVFSAAAYSQMVDRVTAHLKEHGKVSLGEVRTMFNTSRKYAQAFLEYLDGKKVTRRVGDERVLA